MSTAGAGTEYETRDDQLYLRKEEVSRNTRRILDKLGRILSNETLFGRSYQRATEAGRWYHDRKEYRATLQAQRRFLMS